MKTKEEKQVEKKKHNRMYQLFELKDSLNDAITNLQEVIKSNGLLVETIINSKNKEALKELTTSLTNEVKQYVAKIDEYKDRLAKVEHLISLYTAKDENSQFVVEIVSELIEALGIAADPTPAPVKA